MQEGAYFVTICTRNREIIFDRGSYRKIVEECWFDLPKHYPHVELDEFVVMPNHIHSIVVLVGAGLKPVPVPPSTRAGLKPAPTISNDGRNDIRHSLTEIIRAFKTFSARRINDLRRTPGLSVWQRNYFEHVIRSEESLNKILEYVFTNPGQWETDPENPTVQVSDAPLGKAVLF